MIFRSVVSALVVAAIASAAVITVPKYTTSTAHTPLDYGTIRSVESDSGSIYTTAKPADTMTTVKPADKITTAKPADMVSTAKSAAMPTTVKPAETITTVKLAAPVPAQAPMISCYCNLPECLAAAGGDGTCSTRLGCYSEVQPIIPGVEEEIVTPTVTESNNTANGSNVSPIISELVEFVKAPVVATTEHAATIRGSYGCLDQLNFAKQSCEQILKSMEAESSEFPIMQIPTNGAAPSAAIAGVHAFHCCQTERCNGNQSGPAEGSVKSAQAVLVAALNNAVAPHPGVQNSTVGVPWTPAVKSSVNNVELSNNTNSVNNVESSNTKTSVNNVESSNTKTSVNNVKLSNTKKNKEEISDLWFGYFSPLGEPKAPSALKSDTIFEDASSIDTNTPTVTTAMPPKLPVAVPVNQEITHDETVANVEHVVIKRHDGQRAGALSKLNIDDQENISDFDDDIAAEVAAAVATAKSPEMMTDQPDVESSGPLGPPQHGGVPDFIPVPSLKMNFITNHSISATRDVNTNSNISYNNVADNNGSDTKIVGLICTIVVFCIIGLSLLMMFVLRAIIRKYDVFTNYKGVCSNPGEPCACNGGLIWRRPRMQPSSSNPDAAAAAVSRSASTAPLLPPPNPGHKYRGHANAGATYNDSIGDTTYVFTAIPVPDHVTPVRVYRR